MDPVKFIGHERELGAPPDWDAEKHGPCVGLPVQRKDGAWVSVWRPTGEEYARLCAGGDVCLFVYSDGHPAVAVGVSDGSGPIPGEVVPERPVLGDRLHEGYNAGVTVALNVLYRANLIDLEQCAHVLKGLGVFPDEPTARYPDQVAEPVVRTYDPSEDPEVVEVAIEVPTLVVQPECFGFHRSPQHDAEADCMTCPHDDACSRAEGLRNGGDR